MSYEMTARPYLLYETAAMLYRFVNGISCRSTLSLRLETQEETDSAIRQADELQQVLEESCRGLSPADPMLTHYFSSIDTPSGREGTCLGYLLLFSFLSLKHPDFHENIEAIRENWHIIQEKGGWVEGCSLMSLNFSYGDGCPGDFLDQVCRLDLPAEFQISLCRALRSFDRTLDELSALLYPISQRLQKNLAAVSWIWDDRVQYWSMNSPLDYISSTVDQPVFDGETERVTVAVFVMSANLILMKKSETDPSRSYLYIGYSATARSPRRNSQLTCEMMSQALKSISDKKRLEILYRLSQSRAYSYELAESMNIDPSNMSRNLSMLCSYGFLKQKKEGQKIFYETDRSAVRNFLQQLERFILD